MSPSFTVEAASRNGRGEGGLYSSVDKASEIESTGFGEICGCGAVSLAHSGSNRIMLVLLVCIQLWVYQVYIGGRKKKRSGGEGGGGGKRGGGGRRDKGKGEGEEIRERERE